MSRVAACIIAGDSWDESEVKQLLSSLEAAEISGIFVNYNGANSKLPWQKWTSIPVTYKKFEWEDNFALARQQSFSLVPKDEFEWMLWIDTDDVLKLENDATISTVLDSLDEYTQGVFLRYAYSVEPESGVVVVEQWRERLMSTKVPWKWEYPIHEVAKAPPGTQFARREGVFIQHLRQTGEARGARDRNRRIIASARAQYPEEPRYAFYFASETLAAADTEEDPKTKLVLIDAAILSFQEYRMMIDEISDDVYIATTRIADLHRMKGNHADALEADMECIAIYPDWPDGYVGGAKSCMELGQWSRMKSFAHMATLCAKPSTSASIEPLMAGFTPLFLRGIANEELGNFDEAIADYKEAQTRWDPPNNLIEEKIDAIIARKGEDFEEKEDPRKIHRGTRKEKSICFFTEPLPFTWHPDEDNGAGAERCILELAPRFAADGWRTVVFGTPGNHRGVHTDGVEYWNSAEFLPSEEFTVFVASRTLFPFQGRLQAKAKLLWMHDVNNGPGMDSFMDRIDAVVGLTKWHAAHLAKVYSIPSAKLAVVPNGVHPERFPIENWDKSGPPRFIWSSSPDRGLDTLLGLWPLVRRQYSDAELHIFYGWDIIDKLINSHRANGSILTGLENFRHRCVTQIENMGGEEGGIFDRGRLGQKELAEEQAKSLIWPYPTSFMETFCITAIEMQLAGVIPVASGLAALNETVAPVYDKVTGWPLNRDYQQRWLYQLADTMSAEDWQLDEARMLARGHAEKFTWEAAYTKWNDLFKELGVNV